MLYMWGKEYLEKFVQRNSLKSDFNFTGYLLLYYITYSCILYDNGGFVIFTLFKNKFMYRNFLFKMLLK